MKREYLIFQKFIKDIKILKRFKNKINIIKIIL